VRRRDCQSIDGDVDGWLTLAHLIQVAVGNIRIFGGDVLLLGEPGQEPCREVELRSGRIDLRRFGLDICDVELVYPRVTAKESSGM